MILFSLYESISFTRGYNSDLIEQFTYIFLHYIISVNMQITVKIIRLDIHLCTHWQINVYYYFISIKYVVHLVGKIQKEEWLRMITNVSKKKLIIHYQMNENSREFYERPHVYQCSCHRGVIICYNGHSKSWTLNEI